MKKYLIASIMFIILIGLVKAQKEVCVYYFYGAGCPHCANVKPFLDKLEKKYSYLEIQRFEIYHNKTNYELFDSFCAEYNVDNRGIPFVAIGDKYFMGDAPILENLENEILKFSSTGSPCPIPLKCENITKGNESNISPVKPEKISLPLIITAALADGINPCAFSVLIFLATYLLSIGTRKKIIKIGFVYIASVYVSYFLAGMGLLVIIQISGFTKIVYKAAALVALLVGLFNIKDFFFYGKIFSFKIPEVTKGAIEKYTKIATLPSAVILGFLVSAFELPCTGGVYLAILSMLADQTTKFSAVPYLLLYNLIFILPLLILLLIVYFGVSPERAEDWRKSKRKWMKLFSGILMVGLGLWMLMK